MADDQIASGDLRNIIKTATSIPSAYSGTLSLSVNDRDFDIVARNIILILVASTIEDERKASHCILHLWYSALIRRGDLELLTEFVLPLFQDVNNKIASRGSTSLFRKTWKFEAGEISVILPVKEWKRLAAYCTPPELLTTARASIIRAAVTMANARKDYRERNLFAQKPADRVCQQKFLEDGILLPFGHSREEFVIPNLCITQLPSE